MSVTFVIAHDVIFFYNKQRVTDMKGGADMAKLHPPAEKQHNEQPSGLRGTLVSVLVLGGVIAISWVTVFIIYVVRNGG